MGYGYVGVSLCFVVRVMRVGSGFSYPAPLAVRSHVALGQTGCKRERETRLRMEVGWKDGRKGGRREIEAALDCVV